MNVKQLKKLIENLPDNMRIVTPYSDHKYRQVDIDEGTAVYDDDCGFQEDFGDELMKGQRRMSVLIVE